MGPRKKGNGRYSYQVVPKPRVKVIQHRPDGYRKTSLLLMTPHISSSASTEICSDVKDAGRHHVAQCEGLHHTPLSGRYCSFL